MHVASRQPIGKQLFLDHFWWCYSRLADKSDAEYGMAAYFRFLTLVGAHQWIPDIKSFRSNECG